MIFLSKLQNYCRTYRSYGLEVGVCWATHPETPQGTILMNVNMPCKQTLHSTHNKEIIQPAEIM